MQKTDPAVHPDREKYRFSRRKRSAPRSIIVTGTRWMVWAYVLVIVATLIAVEWSTDRWWLATLLAFGPKSIGLFPLLVLVPTSALLRARLLPLLIMTGIVYAVVVMGFCVPFPWQQVSTDGRQQISLMTCNVGGTSDWREVIAKLIDENGIDVVALQEVGRMAPGFPKDWFWVREGKLVIASRFPISKQKKWIRFDPPQKWPPLIAIHAVIEAPGQDLHVCNLHLTSPHHGLAEILDRNTIINPARSGLLENLIWLRAMESAALRAWIDELPQTDVILGDFNMPENSQIYRRCWGDLTNSFGRTGWGYGLTRQATSAKITFGARIDHILTNNNWDAIDCRVGPDVGSDHLPVFAEIAIKE